MESQDQWTRTREVNMPDSLTEWRFAGVSQPNDTTGDVPPKWWQCTSTSDGGRKNEELSVDSASGRERLCETVPLYADL
ncbi:MAG: hypothetical protein KBT07_07535 [Clostridiales bacterium]|nr:hypothetical protein [Candidatus Scatonaster coprocaballi]